MTFFMFLALIVGNVVGWGFYWSVKRDNGALRLALLADDAAALWLHLRDQRVDVVYEHPDGAIPGTWWCGKAYMASRVGATSPDGAVRKYRAMAEAARRVEAELREDS